ncbi:sulfatase family protein [Kiritimatiella glycovorans]|uniref:Arylsulfatase n=1 Tax=Kiritimatiella glycovorans TaxID=1307763 RepID=A0A0G3EFL1_9BACT|nr:arylsulfatase [Kiritimatiella glycovorans]AKJ64192.1 Arylsulfatase [Kiritimatiella glycovorans]
MKRWLTVWILMGFLTSARAARERPNVVIVYADDLGYGDVHCYDPEHCAVPTPHIDRLAGQGIRFTDASNSASLCTPARYSLLTGRYSWRSRLPLHVVRVYGSPLIHPDRLTLGEMLQKEGYHTACIGKWHLGWNWPMVRDDGTLEYVPDDEFRQQREGKVDYSKPIPGGPLDHGFDTYFGIDVPNQPPYAYFRDDKLTSLPTALKGPHTPERWGRNGPMQPDYVFDEVMPNLVREAETYLAARAKDDQPFLLYFALTTPHEPIAPSAEFKGRSGISGVADLIMETDAALGRVMAALDEHGLADDTLLVFASDNGHCSYTPIQPFIDAGHRIGGPYRGYKGFVQEGGMRVPFIVRWPGRIRPGMVSDALVTTVDLMATCAEITGYDLPPDAAEDSVSLLPLLTGRVDAVRETTITHSYLADCLVVRRGPWKLAFAYGSGAPAIIKVREESVDKVAPSESEARKQGLPPVQLYNVATDPEERNNVHDQYPEKVRELTLFARRQLERGRSTPGAEQENDRALSLDLP